MTKIQGNMSREDYKKIDELNKNLEEKPNSLDLLMEKAFVYYHAYAHDHTISAFEKIIELYPCYIHAYFFLAFYLEFFAMRQFDKAIEIARKGLQIDPLHPGLYASIARTLYILQDKEGFRKNMKKALEVDPTWTSNWLTYIQHLISINEISKAKKAINEAYKYILDVKITSTDLVLKKYLFTSFKDSPEYARKGLKRYEEKIRELENQTE